MTTQLQEAKSRLFSGGELGVIDLKITPGSSRDASPESIAEQINKVLLQLEAGDCEIIESFDD